MESNPQNENLGTIYRGRKCVRNLYFRSGENKQNGGKATSGFGVIKAINSTLMIKST